MKSSTLLLIAGLAMAPFAAGYASPISSSDLLIYQVGTLSIAASASASPILIQELDPSLTSQTTPVQTFNITSMSSSLYGDSEGSIGDLALSDGGALLSFAGWTSATSSAENTVVGRGAGTLSASGAYSLAATYSGATGNQARGAYSPDGANWYFDDKGGVYTQGASSPLANSPNTRGILGYGSSTYAMVATSGSTVVGTITPTVPNETSFLYGGLSGLPVDKNAVGFAMASSGHNGAGVYDTLYLTDNPSGSTNFIDKFSLVGSSWVSSGSFGIGSQINVDQLIAKPVSGGNVDIYFTADPSSSHGVAQVDEIVDTSGYDSTIALSGSETLYSAPAGDIVQGISFAPEAAVPEPGSIAVLGLGALLLLAGAGRLRRAFLKA